MLAQIYVVEGPCTIVRDVTRYGGAYYRPEVCTSNFCFFSRRPSGYKKYIESTRRQKPVVTSPAATPSDWVDSYAAS